jgi:hypothetical protein
MQTEEIEIIKEHTAAINNLIEALNTKPVSDENKKEFWTAEECANQLGVGSKLTFAQYIASRPDFPCHVPIPTARSTARPRRVWVAQEVKDWALSNRDKLQARRRPRKVAAQY